MADKASQKMGARELARELAFISVYVYDLTQSSLHELQDMEWYSDMESFSSEDGELFSIQPQIREETLAFYRQILSGTIGNLARIDSVIRDHLVNWSFERLHGPDKAILRVSIYALLYQLDTPIEVIISIANDLAEKYCDDNTPHYINGILNKVKENYRGNKLQKQPSETEKPKGQKKLTLKKKSK
jgi:N utilization substance protein B